MKGIFFGGVTLLRQSTPKKTIECPLKINMLEDVFPIETESLFGGTC